MSGERYPEALISDPSAHSPLVQQVVEKYADELVEMRRDIHRHPELSWSETRTTDLAAARLRRAGWRLRSLTSASARAAPTNRPHPL